MADETWDSVTSDTPASGVGESTVAETPVEASETLEAEPPLAADETVRESEPEQVSEPDKAEEVKEDGDEDVQETDTPEILALPSGSSARRWARRQYEDAQPLRAYLDFEKPISTVTEDLHNRSQARYAEMVGDIADHHTEYISQRLFGLPYEEAQRRLQANESHPEIPTQPTTQGPLTTDVLDQLPFEVAETLEQFQQAQAQEKAELKAANEALQKRLDALEGKVTTREQQDEQKALATMEKEANQIQLDFYDSVWTVVDECIRDSGLEVSKDDPPKIQNLKKAAQKIIATEIEPAFDSVDENKKLLQQIFATTAALTRKENRETDPKRVREIVFREEDQFKVRARNAFSEVFKGAEIQELVNDIKAYGQSGKSRTVPPPPVPGAPSGVRVVEPKTWDEAVRV